jgi:hypothetical protein
MDDMPVNVVDFAPDNAFNAATMRCSAAALFDSRVEQSAFGLGYGNRLPLLVRGGGLPLVHCGRGLRNRRIGGKGFSGYRLRQGNHHGDHDEPGAESAKTLCPS